MPIPSHHSTKNGDAVPSWLVDNMQSVMVSTFGKMFGKTSCLDPNEVNNESHYDGVIGIISFVGDLTWSMALGLPHRAAESLAEKLAGFEIPFDSPDMADVVGELTNVVAGVISGQLEKINLKIHMSLPTVARGSDFQLAMTDRLISQRLHFKISDHDFWVKIIVAKQ